MPDEMADAVRTSAVKLSDDRWTDLGLGPALVGAYGDEVIVAISDAEPGPDDVGFMLRFNANPLPLATEARLWGRACVGSQFARAVIAPLVTNVMGKPR
jgi:hypothetical protein